MEKAQSEIGEPSVVAASAAAASASLDPPLQIAVVKPLQIGEPSVVAACLRRSRSTAPDRRRQAAPDRVVEREASSGTRLAVAAAADAVAEADEETKASSGFHQLFSHLIFNVVLQMVLGKRYFSLGTVDDEKAGRCVKAVKEFMRLFGVFTVGDDVPWLRWFDFGGHEKAMKDTAKKMDSLVSEWLEEHRQNKALGGKVDGFQDVYMFIHEFRFSAVTFV
ncbi:cytochrome P450 82A4-like [Vigna angularis]|uniref:cytochrome P450 82A4-like n=1 Tax=Phaseolus angularis TaxID=3914 RepID=UPI0022B4EBD9|nr:cytochrome P450 82A4-like [Vigna angularis]